MPDLTPGTTVTIRVPQVPTVTATPPPTSTVRVLVEAGPRGAAGVGYVHTQTTPSASWTVVHNLGRQPGIAVYVGSELVLADVTVIDANTISIPFPVPTTGVAVLS